MSNKKARKGKKTGKKKTAKKRSGIVLNFKTWVGLPDQLRTYITDAEIEYRNLQDILADYRVVTVGFEHLNEDVDSEIWEHFHWIQNEYKSLRSITDSYTLRLRGLKNLRQLDTRWQTLFTKKKHLQTEISKAPKKLEEYDQELTVIADQQKAQESDKIYQNTYAEAFQSLEKAFQYIDDYNKEHSISIFGASVLNFDKAYRQWRSRRSHITKMKREKKNIKLVLAEIETLTKMIYDIPMLTKWIHDIEERFSRFSKDNNLLTNTYARTIVPPETFAEMDKALKDQVPILWADGQKAVLTDHLNEIDKFLETYEPEVQSTIAFEERHNPLKATTTINAGDPTYQLIDLTKVLMSAMEARDKYLINHSLMVSKLAVATAQAMKWEKSDIKSLEMAALLHDVGKLWLPESLLTKESRLSKDDVQMIQMHPVYGAQILGSSDLFKKISPWVYHHQERWNGSGYPDGLQGDEIPIESRIIAICESFHAMISGKPGRKAFTIEQAIDQISFDAGSDFDPQITEIFIQVVQSNADNLLNIRAMPAPT